MSLNATDAARKSGYSKKAASQIAYENMRKPEISQAINERMKLVCMERELYRARISQELNCIAFGKNKSVSVAHRMKAMELLSKIHRIFETEPPTIEETPSESTTEILRRRLNEYLAQEDARTKQD